ncbi:MAG: SpoIID/LytB domain-containing protein [Nitriliruptoraceae bacterium]
MRRSVMHRVVLSALVVVLLATTSAGVAAAVDGTDPAEPTDPADPAEPDAQVEPIVHQVDGTLRFVVDDPAVLRFAGRHFYDTLELASPTLLVNELSMDDYIAGIAEMPTRWPMEALKAQAVAARTYAWRSMRRGSWPGYDICATVACQVFNGADVVIDRPTGSRWRQAVDETAGQVLVDGEGEPILARYFSTSGGRTYANEDVFPGDGTFDYLQRIEDPYDETSPLHRWTVIFTREQFDELLSRGDTLSAVSPMVAVERVGEPDDPNGEVRVTGANGRTVDVGATAFRRFVSQVAASLFPDEHPGATDDGEGTLPTALPSSRYDFEVTDAEVTIAGQGWGHGVGMGQFGAMGRAESGHDHLEILAAYYGGLEPVVPANLPDRIRVGMSTSVPAELSATHRFAIHVDGDVLVGDALGTWDVEREDDGWRLTAPEGHGQPLQLSPTVAAPGVPAMRDAATVQVEVNKPVVLTLTVMTADGDPVASREIGVVEAGVHAHTWRFDRPDGGPVDAGTYLVVLEGEDHTGEVAGTPLAVEVPEPPPPPPPPPLASEDGPATGVVQPSAFGWALVAGAIGLVLLLGSLLWRRRR